MKIEKIKASFYLRFYNNEEDKQPITLQCPCCGADMYPNEITLHLLMGDKKTIVYVCEFMCDEIVDTEDGDEAG